jgi:hypothetical protein
MKLKAFILCILLTSLILSACGPVQESPIQPSETATIVMQDTSTPLPTDTTEPTPTETSTLTVIPTPNFESSVLVAQFSSAPTFTGETTACDLVSPTYKTPDIYISVSLWMDQGHTIPAEDIPIAMVRSDANGALLVNDANQYVVLASGLLQRQQEGVTGTYTHTATLNGIVLSDPPFYYQVRVLNQDGTLDGQIGGEIANCRIKYLPPATATPVGNNNDGGETCPDGSTPDPVYGCNFH